MCLRLTTDRARWCGLCWKNWEVGEFGNFEIHHVDARFSDTMEAIGQSGVGKVLRAVRFSIVAIRMRFKHGVRDFYYVPAPPKQGAMIRDWIVLALCRPFYPRVTFHWHAVGLGEWTEQAKKSDSLKMRAAAWMNRKLLGRHYRSMVLTEWGRGDVVPFDPENISVVPNGISDPCEEFEEKLLKEGENGERCYPQQLVRSEIPRFSGFAIWDTAVRKKACGTRWRQWLWPMPIWKAMAAL